MSFEKFDFPVPIFISKVEEHAAIKDDVLRMIAEQKSSRITQEGMSVTTDWFDDSGKTRPYFEFLRPKMDVYIQRLMTEYFKGLVPSVNYTYKNVWYQQYYHNDEHTWHNHGSAMWANVYFVELPPGTPKTEFYIPLSDNKTMTFPVEEGTLLTFPGCVCHRSPPNEEAKRKTIVSFNISMLG